MQDKLLELKSKIEKLKAVGELYEELLSREIRNEEELEKAKLRYDYLKQKALELSLESKKLVQKIEKEDIP
ncbi:hypothetical protein KY308_01645 [Candidatus Woesearchaeota archaeon]|nr:hypothetical protein [Candidatus Woesearchaeota archaeon]